jgi:hypothetical protein
MPVDRPTSCRPGVAGLVGAGQPAAMCPRPQPAAATRDGPAREDPTWFFDMGEGRLRLRLRDGRRWPSDPVAAAPPRRTSNGSLRPTVYRAALTVKLAFVCDPAVTVICCGALVDWFWPELVNTSTKPDTHQVPGASSSV